MGSTRIVYFSFDAGGAYNAHFVVWKQAPKVILVKITRRYNTFTDLACSIHHCKEMDHILWYPRSGSGNTYFNGRLRRFADSSDEHLNWVQAKETKNCDLAKLKHQRSRAVSSNNESLQDFLFRCAPERTLSISDHSRFEPGIALLKETFRHMSHRRN